MRNERPSFMRSAIAAAISSSFICTAALCNDFEIKTFTWDAKNSGFSEGSAKVELAQTESEGSSFKQSIGQASRLDEKNMPYFRFLDKELKDSGIDVVVETENKVTEEKGQLASHFTVSIQKDGKSAIKMSRNLESGETIFSIQKKLHRGQKFHSELTTYLKKKSIETLTIDDTEVAAPNAAKIIFQRLAANTHALTNKGHDDFTEIVIQLKGVSDSPSFINTAPSAAESPDTATMVDVDGAIAAMMTAYTQSYLTESGDLKKTQALLKSMLSNQPGFMVGAKDTSDLAQFEDVPVFLIHQTEGSTPREIELIPHSAAAAVLLERHKYQQPTDSYQDITLSRSSAKDLRSKASASQLQRLIKMKARNKHSGALPEELEIQKLASDQELLFLCAAKLSHESGSKSIMTLTSQEQSRTAQLMNTKSLLTYLRGQFMNHPEVGDFVMGADFEQAVNAHMAERGGSQGATEDDHQDSLDHTDAIFKKRHRTSKQQVNDHQDSLDYLNAFYRKTHRSSEQRVNDHHNAAKTESAEKSVQDLTQERQQLADTQEVLKEQLKKTKDEVAAHLEELKQDNTLLTQERQQLADTQEVLKEQLKKTKDELAAHLEELKQAAEIQNDESVEQVIEDLHQAIAQKTDLNKELQSKLDTISKLLDITEANLDGSFHPDSTRYVRGDIAGLLHPDIVRHDDILSNNEFLALQQLNLPKDMLPDEVVQKLKDMAPLMEHFDGESSITLDQFADNLPGLRKQYFLPPRQAGESGQLKPELKAEFQQYIKESFGADDPVPFVNVIENFNPEDVLKFGVYARAIKKITTSPTEQPLLQRLNTYHMMSLQVDELDHETLSTMCEYYKLAPEEYRIMWNQIERDRLQKWLDETMFVPDAEELNNFPESQYLPNEKRLNTFKDIASYSPTLTAEALASYVQAAGKVMYFLSPGQLVQLQLELEQAPVPQQADASDYSVVEDQYKEIALRFRMPEASWEDLLTLARQPAGLWEHTYKVIQENGGTKAVRPDDVTPEEMKLAQSPFDSITVIKTRKLKELNPVAYTAKMTAQEALQEETNRRMEGLIKVATDSIAYTSEQLQSYPGNSDLQDKNWVEPLKAFYQKLEGRFNRREIVQYAKLLASFSPDEYNSLISTINSVIDLVDPKEGIHPGRELEFDDTLMGAKLTDRSIEVLKYIQLAGENSREYLEKFKEETLSLVQHPQAKVLTVGHIEVAMQEADPQKIMAQRQVLRDNPEYYDFMAIKSAARYWLSKSPELLFDPEAIVTPDMDHAMRHFFYNIIEPGTQGDSDLQLARLNILNNLNDLLTRAGSEDILDRLANNPRVIAGELVETNGNALSVDEGKLKEVATDIGITSDADRKILADLLTAYRTPERISDLRTALETLTDSFKNGPADIAPARLDMVRTPSVEDVYKALTIALSAKTQDVYKSALQANIYKPSARTVKLDQDYKELNAVNELIETYTADSDYNAKRFTSQKQLEEALEATKQDIRETELPAFSKTPEKETPLYKRLQDKHDSLTTGSNLKETREQIESWDDEPLVKITDEIHEPLHRIHNAKLPGEQYIHPDSPDMLDFSSLQTQLKTANSHSGGDRLQEKHTLDQILQLREPKAFQTKFAQYAQSKGDLRPYAEVHNNMLELNELLQVSQWSEEQRTRAVEIITPWAAGKNSENAKPFHQYLAADKGFARHHIEAAYRASLKESPDFRTLIEQAVDSPVIKEAITIGNIRHDLSDVNNDLSKLDELHKTLLTLKSAAETDGASEIEGVESVLGLLADINEESTSDKVIEVVRNFQPSDEASPINKALEMVDGIVETTGSIRNLMIRPALQVTEDTEDLDPVYLKKHEKTIEHFKEDYEGLSKTDVWEEHVKQDSVDLTDENGYPLIDQLEEVKAKIKYPQRQAEQDLKAYHLFVSDPEAGLKEIRELEIKNLELQEELDKRPLFAPSASYVDYYLQLKPGSSEAILLGNLLRLIKAGVPKEFFHKLDFQNPLDARMITVLAKNRNIEPKVLEAITVKLMKSNKLIEPMLNKLDDIEAIESDFRKNILKGTLIKSSAAADRSLKYLSGVSRKAMAQSKDYYDFAMPYIIAEKKDSKVHNEVLGALAFYAESKRLEDPTRIAPNQEALDKIGLTRNKSERFLERITGSWKLDEYQRVVDIIEIALLDLANAELWRYEKFGYKVRQQIAAMKAYASDKAQRFDATTASARKWLIDSGYTAGTASYHTIENLLYLYFRNRLNVYLDDIAYNDGRGLIAAINDAGEGLDEFLLAAGLVRGEHQQQLVSDILNYFGKEAFRVYDERFRHILGERADFMDNVLKPVSLAVQAPVGFHEIGATLKLGGADNIWSWNTARHTFEYTAIGIIVDMTRGNQYNKMMINAIDPAMTNLAEWMDSKAPLYSDQASPEDKYYSELWSSTVRHWNGWHDYLGQSNIAKMMRAPAELAQSLVTTRIYGTALIPALNPVAFTRTNPAIRAANKAVMDAGAFQQEVSYWQPGFKSVVAYYLAKGVNDWSRNDLAGTKYLLEGFAGVADNMNGVPTNAKNSWSQRLEKNLHKLSLSHQDTRFAEGKDLEAWTPITETVKVVATGAARVGQVTGLDQLGGFSQGTYDKFGKPDLADQVRRPNTVSSWISTLSEYGARAMKSSGASDAVLWGFEKIGTPVMSALSTASGGISTVGGGIVSAALTARKKWQSVEEVIYESLGYQLVRKSGSEVADEHDTSQTVDPGQSGGDEASEEQIPDLQPATDQDENDESKVADQIAASEQSQAIEPPVTEDDVKQPETASGEDSEEDKPYYGDEADTEEEPYYGDDEEDDVADPYDEDDEASDEDNNEEGIS